jgi:hypothetical protein
MFLFSIFITFIISWSPGITLLWVGILTLFLSTLGEFRAQARNTLKEGLTQIVTFTGNKLGLRYLCGNAGGGMSNTPSPECLKLNITAKERRHNYQQRKKQDALWNKETGLLHITPERDDVEKATHYNFKVKCRINTDSHVVAEVDTDSHLNLISAKYFERINNRGSVTFLNEQPTEYSGLGSSLRSEYPPVILSIQIGHCTVAAEKTGRSR